MDVNIDSEEQVSLVNAYQKVTFLYQMERTYLGSPKVVAVLDHEWKRTYVTGKEGLLDKVKNHIP